MSLTKHIVSTPPPRAPKELTVDWANQLTRWLTELYPADGSMAYLRGGGLYLQDLPSTGHGLKTGGVFSNAGILTVVREDDIWIGGVKVSVSPGTVTVAIT